MRFRTNKEVGRNFNTTILSSQIDSVDWSLIINTPTTLSGYGITDGVISSRTLTINGTTYDLSANRTWSVGTITSITASSPLTGGTITSSGSIGITQANTTTSGYLSSTDWNTFNGKQSALSGTGFVKISGTTISYDNSTYYLASNPSGYTSNVGTVTSVAALTLGTSGTDLSSSVATGSTTPVITLNVPTASATNRGVLSSSDYTTFNGKFTLPSLTSGSVLFSNGTTISQNNANFFWDNANQRLGIGTATPSAIFHSVGTVSSASLIGRGAYFNNTIAATANNDVLVGLDINPTFTNGAFTGVTNTALRVTGTASISSSLTANIIIKSGGTSSQFLKADGSVDSTTYGTFTLPSLTSGSVLFSNGTTISQDNANFFWDNTNKRLGIGTNTLVSDFTIRKSGDSGARFESTNSAKEAYISAVNSSGEYGALEIFGSTYGTVSQRNLLQLTSSTVNGFAFILYNNNANANFKIMTGISLVERFRLFNNTGNVVIQSGGTFTDAGYKLDTFGTVRFTAPSANAVLNVRASDVGTAAISILGNQTGDVDWLIMSGYPAVGDFSIRQSSVITALTIKKTTGIVLINTSTTTTSEPLQVNGNIRSNGALIGGGTNISALVTSGYLVNGTNTTPILNLDGTWNSATANPTAIKLNITNTASGTSSKLIDLQISSATKFNVGNTGIVRIGAYGSGTIVSASPTYNLAVDASGNVVETALPSVPISTITSGTYTPTASGASNCTVGTIQSAQYMQVGYVVTVSGEFTLTPTNTTAPYYVYLTIPVNSIFTSHFEYASGVCNRLESTSTPGTAGVVYADGSANNNKVYLYFHRSPSATSNKYIYTYTYRIILPT